MNHRSLAAAAFILLTGCNASTVSSSQNILPGSSSPASQEAISRSLSSAVTATPTQYVIVLNGHYNKVLLYQPGVPGAVHWIGSDRGIACPNYGVVDSNDNLFISNSCGDTVTEYAYPYVDNPIATIRHEHQAQQLALDANRDLFVLKQEGEGDLIDVFAAPYTSAPVATLHIGLHGGRMAVNSKGDVIATFGPNRDVVEFTPPYSSPPQTLFSNGNPDFLYFDKSDNFWISNRINPISVAEYAPPYTGAPVVDIVPGKQHTLGSPWAIYVDSSRNLWVADDAGPSGRAGIRKFTPPYTAAPAFYASNSGGFFQATDPLAFAFDKENSLFAVTLTAFLWVSKWEGDYRGHPSELSGAPFHQYSAWGILVSN